MEHKNSDKRMLVGIVILLAGAALLASNFGILSYEIKRYIFRWEVILIVVGFLSLFTSHNKGFAIVIMVVGIAFYLRDFFNFNYNFWQLFWPAMLIIAGLTILFHKHTHQRVHNFSGTSEDFLDEVTVFGGTEKVINSENFKGGKLTSIFGGQKLIFSRAKMSGGKNTLEIFALFGGYELVIPETWEVKVNITPIFGGFSDKRLSPVKSGEGTGSELLITGTVIFGGGEIKSY